MRNLDDTLVLPPLLRPPVIRNPQEFAYGEISPNRFLTQSPSTVKSVCSPPQPHPIPARKHKKSRPTNFSSSYPPQEPSNIELPPCKTKSKHVKKTSPKGLDTEQVKESPPNIDVEEGNGIAQIAKDVAGDGETEPAKNKKKKERKYRRKLELVLPDMLSASSLLTSPFKKKNPSRARSVDSGRERLQRNTSDPINNTSPVMTDHMYLSEPPTASTQMPRHHRSNPTIRPPQISSMEKLSAMAEILSFGIIKSPRRHSTGSLVCPPELSDSEDPDASNDEREFSFLVTPPHKEKSGIAISEFEMSPLPDVELLGRKPDVKHTLTAEMAELVREHLPARLRLAEQWRLLYSIEQHGTSLSTLYHAVAGKWALVIVVKDTAGGVFGAFVPQELKPHVGYYGNGECFLWMIISSEGRTTGLRLYPWTGKNDYFMISEADYFGIGGGNGKFGLYLDSSFIKGSTAPCPTFDNEALTGNGEQFECAEFEVWGIPFNAYFS